MVSGAARIVFGIESVWIGLKCTSQLRLRSFDKPCSEKFVFSICVEVHTDSCLRKYIWVRHCDSAITSSGNKNIKNSTLKNLN